MCQHLYKVYLYVTFSNYNKRKKNPTFDCRLASKVFSGDKSANHSIKPQSIVI